MSCQNYGMYLMVVWALGPRPLLVNVHFTQRASKAPNKTYYRMGSDKWKKCSKLGPKIEMDLWYKKSIFLFGY